MKLWDWYQKLSRGDVIAGCLAGMFVAPFPALAFQHWFAVLAFSTLVFLVAADTRYRYMKALSKRKDDHSITWDVQADGVKVGAITDGDFATIRIEMMNDWRVYVAQGLNLVNGMFGVVKALVVAVPIVAFWLVLAAIIIDPEAMVNLSRQIQGATPEQIVAGLQNAAWAAAVFVLLIGSTATIFGDYFGFKNQFSERTQDLVRWKIGITKVGSLGLCRVHEGERIWNDERKYTRQVRPQ